MIGHRVLPVVGLCPGYRHVALRTECGQPLPLASLFLHVIVKDYVPDGMSDLAEALANPIKYQSALEKREKQLALLTDDLEEPSEGDVEVQFVYFMSVCTTSPSKHEFPSPLLHVKKHPLKKVALSVGSIFGTCQSKIMANH